MAIKLQTIRDIRNFITSELASLYPPRETESIAMIILTHVFKDKTRAQLLSNDEVETGSRKTDAIIRYCRDLKKGKPVQYVTGETEFYGCRLKVSPGVLIPRPETEELVDLVIKENNNFQGKIIDIGTGTGAIAINLALNLPAARVTATDNSVRALRIAAENAVINHAHVTFVKADILKSDTKMSESFDLIVSNPPYVRYSEMLLMNRNVLDFEPHRALFVSDNDPLKFYRAIFNFAEEALSPGGKIYYEINEAMGMQIRKLSELFNYRDIRILKDINGKDRFLHCGKS
ncbi:MAG: peptide chain release factor N(5)-glutamine methyltransferase [Bacteroidota bacterium]|nr:peptide chain release factor N(5)-glutamine methyltransferase [Bacteroidota bacterium]